MDCRRARIAGVVLLGGQLAGLLLAWLMREPSALLAVVPFAVAGPLAWEMLSELAGARTAASTAP